MTLKVDQEHVLIRMYNVGFGDCFLLVFPASDRPRKVLIDCGSHSAGRGPVSIGEIADRIRSDVTEDNGVPRVDVVIGTHRHQDHVSGFNNKVWQEVEVSEVWMPWTEHPTDPEARRIRERQSRIAHSLCLALEAAANPEAESALALAQNSLTNAKAMETLHRGFAGRPKRCFLPNKYARANSFLPDPIPGVTVHAMGPSRDEKVIRDMDPPAGAGYLRLVQGQPENGETTPPFPEGWAIEPEQFLGIDAFEHLRLSDKQMQRINGLSDVDHFQIAAALEKAVNGTSLMLAFELGDALLLFPGDAQWGTWNAVLGEERWRELLARTTFYKIGHHGSHNATPRAFVEDLLGSRRSKPDSFIENFSAAVSTRTMDMWKFIPKKELLAALGGATPRIARSDIRDESVPGFKVIDEIVTETLVPIRAQGEPP
jgi:beta-lactamase superfamily II metal-dependent hydrolase